MSVRTRPIDPLWGVATDKTAKTEYTKDRVWNLDTTECHGGVGTVTSLVEYQKLLQSIIGNDAKVLKVETLNDMFKPPEQCCVSTNQ